MTYTIHTDPECVELRNNTEGTIAAAFKNADGTWTASTRFGGTFRAAEVADATEALATLESFISVQA